MEKRGRRWFISSRLLILASSIALFIFFQGSTHADDVDQEHNYIILKDDFEDTSLSRWSIEETPGEGTESEWSVLLDEGNNVLSLKGHVYAQSGSYSWVNYTLDLRFKFIIPYQAGHLSVRLGETGSRYFIRFDGQDLRLIKNVGSGLPEVQVVDCVLDPGEWYRMKVSCVGDRVRVVVEDSLMIDYVDSDDPLTHGRIGIESGHESHLYFDDVTVYSTYETYVSMLLEKAEKRINQARGEDYDTSFAESKLKEAYNAYVDGKISEAETLATDASEAAYLKKIESSEPTASPSSSPYTFSWSIQEITGLLTICTMFAGVGGWVYRKRTQSRRVRILIGRLMEEINDVFTRYKMNAVRCESELLRLKSEALGEFKEGVIDEENFSLLNTRIDFYLDEIRKELK